MTPSRTPHPDGSERPVVPVPLTLAVGLATLEGLVLVLQGVALLPALDGDRLVMGLTSTLFFVVYGGGLAFCAWRLRQRESWARAPVVLAQLIQVLVGVSFLGGATTWVTVVLVGVALTTLVGVFHPTSLAALAEDPPSS